MSDVPGRVLPLSIVETATALPAADDGWAQVNHLTPRTASQGILAAHGAATITEDLGLMVLPGSDQVTEVTTSAMHQGLLVRLLVEVLPGGDATGAVTRTWVDKTQRRMKPCWWGMVRSVRRIVGPGTNQELTWTCDELWAWLDRVKLVNCPALHGNGTVQTLHRWPVIDPELTGSRSSAKQTVNGRSFYVFDERRGTAAEEGGTLSDHWTARDLVELWLAMAKAPSYLGVSDAGAGMDWQIGDGGDLLDWPTHRLDLHGDSVLAALRQIIDHRRGLTASKRVVGSTVYIDIRSTAAAAVDTGDGWKVPAAPANVLDISATDGQGLFRGDAEVIADATPADIIVVTGGRPLVGLTLWWTRDDGTSALLPDGWDPAHDPDPLVDTSVWRRWRINPAWNGLTWNSPSDPPRGISHPVDTDGKRLINVASSSLRGIGMAHELPWGPMFTNKPGDAERPRAWVYEGGQMTELDTTITPLEDPAGLELARDAGEAERIQGMMSAGATLLVTVGVYEPAPLQVVWQRPKAQWPSPTPRVVTYDRPSLSQKRGVATAVKGIDDSTGGALRTETETIRDDGLGFLRRMLALLWVRHATPGAAATIPIDGYIDTRDSYAPGTFVTGLKVSATVTEPINSQITARTWDFDRGTTTLTTERPDTPIGKLL